MNSLEQQLHYPMGDVLPAPGEAIDVAPGVRWLRMPLPFALDHINLWLLRDRIDGRDGWSIIDCGIDSPTTREYWEKIFATALDGLPVLRVIVTHYHPDHLGLAHWLCKGGDSARWRVGLWMTFGEYAMGRMLTTGTEPDLNVDVTARDFERHGVTDAAVLKQAGSRTSRYRSLVPAVPSRFRRIIDDDTLKIGGRDWRVITGFGHSIEHCALYCAETNVLIGGDMVLPRISTNVSVTPLEPDDDPLAGYLRSLERYRPLPADARVLPSHGKPFHGLHTRIDQLEAHHRERLDEVRHACSQAPHSAAEIVPIMFPRRLDTHQMRFALGEALAHLNWLWHAGELERLDDGELLRFGLAAGPGDRAGASAQVPRGLRGALATSAS